MAYNYKRLQRTIAGMVLVVLLFAPIYIKHNINDKTRLDTAEKVKIQALIKSCKGTAPNLQTDNNILEWKEEAVKIQTGFMNDVLDNLSVMRSSLTGRPKKYISAYYRNISIYIPYSDFDPAASIIIKADNKFYLARCSQADSVQRVISYMIKNSAIK